MLNSKTDKSAVGFYFPNQDSSFTDSLKESLEQVEETTNFNPIQDFKGLVSDDVAFETGAFDGRACGGIGEGAGGAHRDA